jgi:hypothetical protein
MHGEIGESTPTSAPTGLRLVDNWYRRRPGVLGVDSPKTGSPFTKTLTSIVLQKKAKILASLFS